MKLPKPIHEVWCSVDNCNEFYGWEPIESVGKQTLERLSPDDHRHLYSAAQMRAMYLQGLEDCLAIAEKYNWGQGPAMIIGAIRAIKEKAE